ncbi:hypothetical protein BJV82DRAFT_534050 [Fennellomyces sp. T-0311]|nr:hypothetical protein BJV82DRAFT_534050 [Fennellomyces sp. T-0311]
MFSPATNAMVNDYDWVYDPSIMNYQPPQEPLQEPVPFEDFKFSFGLDPDFSMPFLPEASTSALPNLWPVLDNNNSNNYNNTTVLNEDDKKEFSSFLDSFFVDPQQEEQEERRRSSILRSLDEQKRKFLTGAVMASSQPTKRTSDHDEQSVPRKRSKSSRELLTEDEKRANHIASEQKRRSTIRTGFKDLTDLIPTLKNINNSKSTVLFKAVDFIKHLEKRNKGLNDKIAQLEKRVQEARRFSSSSSISSSSSASEAVSPATDLLQPQESQEQRLLKLQEQLQFHQRLLSQQQQLHHF